jgi:hypothetical protein
MLFDGQELLISSGAPNVLIKQGFPLVPASIDGLFYANGVVAGVSSITTDKPLDKHTDFKKLGLCIGAFVVDFTTQRSDGIFSKSGELAGPMAEPRLMPCSAIHFLAHKTIQRATIAEILAMEETANSISQVSVDVFAEYWRQRNARVGRLNTEYKIVWKAGYN